MINSPRFEEHCQHEHDADIEQYRNHCKDFDQYGEEEAMEDMIQEELNEIVERNVGILGDAFSQNQGVMSVQTIYTQRIGTKNIIMLKGIVCDIYDNYSEDTWYLGDTQYVSDTIDYILDNIDWFDKTCLVPVEYRNDKYRYYTFMTLAEFLIQSEDNYIHSEPVYLCSIEDVEGSKPKYFHPDYQDLDDFIDSQLYVDHLMDIWNGNDLEAEYNLRLKSYQTVASQFDSCDFYDNIEAPCILTETPSIDDDLPF